MDQRSCSCTSKPVSRIFYGIENLVHILKNTQLSAPKWLMPVEELLSDVALEPVLLSGEKYTVSGHFSTGSEPFVPRQRFRAHEAPVRKKTVFDTADDLHSGYNMKEPDGIFDVTSSDYIYDGRVPIPHQNSYDRENEGGVKSDRYNPSGSVSLVPNEKKCVSERFDEYVNPLYSKINIPDQTSCSRPSSMDCHQNMVPTNSIKSSDHVGDKVNGPITPISQNSALNTQSNFSNASIVTNAQPAESLKSVKIVDIGGPDDTGKNLHSTHNKQSRVQNLQENSASGKKANFGKDVHVGKSNAEPTSSQDNNKHVFGAKSSGKSKKKALPADSKPLNIDSSASTSNKQPTKNNQQIAKNKSAPFSKAQKTSALKEAAKPPTNVKKPVGEARREKNSKNGHQQSHQTPHKDEENLQFWHAAVNTSNKTESR